MTPIAKFETIIPMLKASAADPVHLTAHRERVAGMAPRVVVVDDDTEGAEVLGVLLGTAGYEASFATSGEAGMALAVSRPPEILLVDLGLPDIDGFEVARRVRADSRVSGVRMIAITGYRGMKRAAALGGGFDGLLRKPILTADLLAALTLEPDGVDS